MLRPFLPRLPDVRAPTHTQTQNIENSNILEFIYFEKNCVFIRLNKLL